MSFFDKISANHQKRTEKKIQIDTLTVADAARQISESNRIMIETTNSIKKNLEALESCWDSPILNDFKTRVGKTQEVYDQYNAIIAGMAEFLNAAAQAYENTEIKIKNSADKF